MAGGAGTGFEGRSRTPAESCGRRQPRSIGVAGEYIARAVFLLYDGLVALVVWLLLVPLELAAVLAGSSTLERLAARLGRPPRWFARRGRLLVVHAVSVGEMAAAAALVRHWVRRHPDDRLVLTAGNRDGLAAGERLAAEVPAIAAVVPLPWDRRRALARWLEALAPDLVVGIESEIWPSLFRGCRELGIPLALASARLYPPDVARYRLLPGFFRRVLAAADWIGVQSAGERLRWLAIGALPERLEIVGNLKYDTPAPELSGQPPTLPTGALRIVAASTHPGEESQLLRALANLPADAGAPQLVLAPRHPRRAAAIVRAARRAGFVTQTLSASERAGGKDGCSEAPARVLVVDRFGWLPAAVATADIVVIGGTFARHGGHNPLEAARAGRALLVGPHVENFAEVVAHLRAQGGLREVAVASALPAALADLLRDPAERRRLGAGAAVATASGSCVELYAERLEALLAGTRRAGWRSRGVHGASGRRRAQVARAHPVS